MDHFWQSIPNYTSTPDYFAWLAEKATERQWKTIVLVGIYQGASASCLAVELYNRQAPTRIDLVDWWQAVQEVRRHAPRGPRCYTHRPVARRP